MAATGPPQFSSTPTSPISSEPNRELRTPCLQLKEKGPANPALHDNFYQRELSVVDEAQNVLSEAFALPLMGGMVRLFVDVEYGLRNHALDVVRRLCAVEVAGPSVDQ